MNSKGENVVIVGAGCFGISTAHHLLLRGYTDVTILDRSSSLPAPDAASNDFNRSQFTLSLFSYQSLTFTPENFIPGANSLDLVVRSSYDDRFYAELAREAIVSWKNPEIWDDTYHESGVIVLGSNQAAYADESYKNDVAMGANVKILKDTNEIRSVFPGQVRIGSFSNCAGYLNSDGGWANAGQGISLLIDKVKSLQGKVVPGMNVAKILRKDGRTTGVECSDGAVYNASLVIIASGSWTPSAFPELDLGRMCLATGQCIAMVQLSDSEADSYRKCPVVLDFSSGFYVFPPNAENIVKLAIHSAGFTHFDDANSTISTPRTIASDPVRGLLIPRASVQGLRAHLAEVYPDLAEKPFSGTRLCWYNDSPDGNWVIGRYPQDEGLIIATGGSGHAYKFLPVIGRLVVDLIEEKLDRELEAKFAIEREVLRGDSSRSGLPKRLDLTELCEPDDLQALEK